MMNLLFHCCCAPCALACVKYFSDEGIEPALFWYNPNIHPFTEYKSRKDTLVGFAQTKKLKLLLPDSQEQPENGYGLKPFIIAVFNEMENIDGRRCKLCYSMRLEKTAEFAANNGFNTFSTSLLISPYQNHDEIRRAGEEAAVKYGVDFYYNDFRPLFRQGQNEARSSGLYMQKYCGCIFSEEEKGAHRWH